MQRKEHLYRGWGSMGRTQTGSTTTKYCIRYSPQKGEFLIGSRNGIFERYIHHIHGEKTTAIRIHAHTNTGSKYMQPSKKSYHACMHVYAW